MENQFSDAWAKISDKFSSWIDTFLTNIPSLVLAILILIVAAALGAFVARYAKKFSSKVSHNRSVSSIIGSVTKVIFILGGLIIALSVLGLDKAFTSLLAGAGVVGLAIGLALQEPLINTVAGIIISIRKYYKIGDIVEAADVMGKVKVISLRYMVIDKTTGEEVIVPNKEILESKWKIYSVAERRIDLSCGVSYDSDLQQVKDAVWEVMKKMEEEDDRVFKDRSEFYFTGFGDSSIDFVAKIWIDNTSLQRYQDVESELIMNIKKRFDEEDIDIPFPIRTLHFPKERENGLIVNIQNGNSEQQVNSDSRSE